MKCTVGGLRPLQVHVEREGKPHTQRIIFYQLALAYLAASILTCSLRHIAAVTVQDGSADVHVAATGGHVGVVDNMGGCWLGGGLHMQQL